MGSAAAGGTEWNCFIFRMIKGTEKSENGGDAAGIDCVI